MSTNNKSTKRRPSTMSIHVSELGFDFNNQSNPDPNEKDARISALCAEDDVKNYFREDNVHTIYDSFQRGVKKSGDNRCLGWKPDSNTPYKWMTYNEVNQRAINFGAGLMALGLKPCNENRIGLYSQNRPEYVIADQGLIRHSLCTVPLYDTLGTEASTFIINQAEIGTIVCDNNEKVKKILSKRRDMPCLSTIILCEAISEESSAMAKDEGVDIMHFSDVEKLGSKNPVEPTLPKPEDLYTVCYTSGTTGEPKGVMITHGNIIHNMKGCFVAWEKSGISFHETDCHISYLPLAHAYEKIIQSLFLCEGVAIGFFQGDVRKLLDDIKELQPTIFPCVPRLLNRIHDKIMSGVQQSRIKKFLFNKALNSKKKDLQKGIIRNNTIWDKLVFSKIQQALGGRVRLVCTGSAPLSAEVLTFLKCAIGCPIFEGYGQTESTAVSSLTLLGDSESGHVGPPLPGVKIKVVDVPEMNYLAKNNQGEVCLKGDSITKGYLKNEEKTQEAIDEDGWLHTGDIGEWLPTGTLRLIDRKKHIFKLAQGEYIAPEKIENILVQSAYLAQAFVWGHSLESCLVAVVVPDPEELPVLAGALGVSGSLEEMVANPVLKKAIQMDIKEIGNRCGLFGFEQVKEIHIHPELFTTENGLLTPTFKSKRNELASFFAKEIKEMYEKLKLATNSKL